MHADTELDDEDAWSQALCSSAFCKLWRSPYPAKYHDLTGCRISPFEWVAKTRGSVATQLRPRGSKYPILKDSSSKNHTLDGLLGPESLNIGYLDTLGGGKPQAWSSFRDIMSKTRSTEERAEDAALPGFMGMAGMEHLKGVQAITRMGEREREREMSIYLSIYPSMYRSIWDFQPCAWSNTVRSHSCDVTCSQTALDQLLQASFMLAMAFIHGQRSIRRLPSDRQSWKCAFCTTGSKTLEQGSMMASALPPSFVCFSCLRRQGGHVPSFWRQPE